MRVERSQAKPGWAFLLDYLFTVRGSSGDRVSCVPAPSTTLFPCAVAEAAMGWESVPQDSTLEMLGKGVD